MPDVMKTLEEYPETVDKLASACLKLQSHGASELVFAGGFQIELPANRDK